MSLGIITVGDTTDHGGKVISGSPTHTVGGKAIARLGDLVDCPQKYPGGRPHGVNKIVDAHPTVTMGGVPVAVDGCHSECGCVLIASGNAAVGD
ncbi:MULTISPECIES: PAAR domain-containing protein [unclassified Cupriavidus]|uniref:PAAR domain-containing protein n=1 Tax=unclassified Cupriavidus TaxID=2640874 RepID=UPI0010F550AE|nr:MULTISPECIES: PAAR domain-containing protein [unclassified Cupriavidus]MWL87318.1 PAAR domain-containing protein [Cupriavidus sp. SW-Y-13]